jgi:hypothetical protein
LAFTLLTSLVLLSHPSSIPTQLLFPPRGTTPGTPQPTITIHVTTQELGRAAILRLNVDVFEFQAGTGRAFAAVDAGCDIVSIRSVRSCYSEVGPNMAMKDSKHTGSYP